MGIESSGVVSPSLDNFRFLPWAEPAQFYSAPTPPAKHEQVIFSTYNSVCGGGKGSTSPRSMSQFRDTYAAYAATFGEGPSLRKIFYRLSANGAEWVRNDFNAWLDGGRRCAEGTPGYNKFVLTENTFAGAGSSAYLARHVRERLRIATQSMLATNLFYYDLGRNRITFDESVLNANLRSERSRNKLAARGGFENLVFDTDSGFYRNGGGDTLVLGNNFILWSSFSRSISFVAQFIKGEGGRQTVDGQAFVIRKGVDILRHPIIEHTDGILAYLHALETRSMPLVETPPPLNEVLGVYGYLYLNSNQDRTVGETFKRAAMKYETVGRMIGFPRNGESIDDNNKKEMWYKAAEQYYLASAIYVAMGDFSSAGGMLNDMTRCLVMAGIDYSDKVQKVEKAIARLSYRRNSVPPSNGGQALSGGSSVTGLAETGETSSGAASGAALSRALPVTPQGRLAQAGGFFISRSRITAQYRAPRHAWLSGAIFFNPKLALAR